jgi:hypothetical protein
MPSCGSLEDGLGATDPDETSGVASGVDLVPATVKISVPVIGCPSAEPTR